MDVRLPDGTIIQNVPDTITKAELTAKLQKNGYDISKLDDPKNYSDVTEQAPLGSRLLRQAGLTARAGIEGAADIAGVFSDPIAAVMNNTVGTHASRASDVGAYISNAIGLPKPENSTERVVQDASKLLVGTGGVIKGAQLASGAVSPVAQSVLRSLSANPGMQASSAIGSGAAGGIARENGAGTGGQFAAALAGGVALPVATNKVSQIGGDAINRIRNYLDVKGVEQRATQAIQQAGVTLEGLEPSVQQSIMNDVKQAVKTGDNLSPDAIRRLADYRAVGATPMSSSLTLNPAEITRDRNLAKLSANSRDPAAQQLANLQRENDVTLINRLNDLGAGQADDSISAANKIIGALDVKDQAARHAIDAYYKQARATSGRSAMLDPKTFTQRANDLLDESMLGGKLPVDVRNNLNRIANGDIPLTVDVAEQYKTAIGTLQRASTDPAERLALGHVRRALEETPLLEGQGQEAINAFNQARKVNREYMQLVEKTPALQAVRDGVEPDKFVQTYIIGNGAKANISDVAALRDSLKGNDEAIQTIRGQLAAYLKNKAVNGSADEVANFSPKAYQKALQDIGDAKLNMFFSPQDITMLKTIGRVGSYEKFQPTGSAVNNSNTAAAAFTAILDHLANSPFIRKIPMGSALIANPAQDVSVAVNARKALNSSKALAKPLPKQPAKALPIGAALYGEDSSPSE